LYTELSNHFQPALLKAQDGFSLAILGSDTVPSAGLGKSSSTALLGCHLNRRVSRQRLVQDEPVFSQAILLLLKIHPPKEQESQEDA
jgi:hypothetical protein